MPLQNCYELSSFIEFIPGTTEEENHYVAYKAVNDRWLRFDDHEVDLLQQLEQFYRVNLLFYRKMTNTRKYTINIFFPQQTAYNTRQKMQRATGNNKNYIM